MIKQREGNKTRVERNIIKNRRTIEEINETKSCFLGKINTIDKLVNEPRKKKKKTQVSKIKSERQDTTTDLLEKKRIILRENHKQLHASVLVVYNN